MRQCQACGVSNADEKAACYSCGRPLMIMSPTTSPYPPPYSTQPPLSQYPPPGQLQQPAAPPAYAPQPPYQQPHQQSPYPQQPPSQPYPPQSYAPQPGAPQQYAPAPYPQQPYPGGYPQQMPPTAPGDSPAERVRVAQIKTQYRTITRYLLYALLVTLVLAFAIVYGLKDQQIVLGLPRVVWGCAPILGFLAFAIAVCRCPACKATLMMKSEINETGECPSCGARLK